MSYGSASMSYEWNCDWETRLSDLARRSNTQHISSYARSNRLYPKANHVEWAYMGFLGLQNCFMITSWLLDIERKIERRSGGEIAHSDPLYVTRRFEYPWVFMRLPQKKCRILDAGGGPGPLQYLLSMLNMEVVNVDINKEFLAEVEKVKALFAEFSPIKTVNQDFSQLPYSDNYFDATVCVSAIEHGNHDKIAEIISEFRRVTRGSIMITMDVSLEQRSHPECVSLRLLKKVIGRFGLVIPPFPRDLMVVETWDKHKFTVANIYLHGEGI